MPAASSRSIVPAIVALTLWRIPAMAQDMSMLGGGAEGIVVSLEHQSESAPTSLQTFGIEEQKAFVAAPLHSNESGDSIGIFFRGQRMLLSQALVFPDRGVETPEEFGTAELGANWSRKDQEGNRLGFNATYGSAGRRLLDNGLDPIVTATVTMEKKAESGGSWIYFVNYSNNRALLNRIPIPGVAYSMRGSASNLVIGLPFLFAMWRPDPFMASLVASPWAISTDIAYRFWGPLMVFTGVGWQPKAYQNLVKGSEDRLLFEKKEWASGLRAFFGRKGSASIGYVWNFDRRFLLGRSITDRTSEAIDIEDSGGLQVKARLNF